MFYYYLPKKVANDCIKCAKNMFTSIKEDSEKAKRNIIIIENFSYCISLVCRAMQEGVDYLTIHKFAMPHNVNDEQILCDFEELLTNAGLQVIYDDNDHTYCIELEESRF